MPKNARGKKPVKNMPAGNRSAKIEKRSTTRKPKDAQLAKSAGKMMQMANKMGPGGYQGAKQAIQHLSGKTLATSMGSDQQSDRSKSMASIAGGAFGSTFATTGVFQMLAVKEHKGTLY